MGCAGHPLASQAGISILQKGCNAMDAANATQLEKAGIPVCQVTPVVPMAKMVGPNRIVQGRGIVHVMGDA